MTNFKEIQFKIEDNVEINILMGQRGTLYATAAVEQIDKEHKSYSINYEFQWEPSFTEEKSDVDEEHEQVLIVALAKMELSGEKLYELEEDTIHNLSVPLVKENTETKKFPSNMEVFLTFSTDQWQTNTSYELEGISSTLEEARRVVERIFTEYGCDTKAVIKAAIVDFQDFSDVEVYSYDFGLEWKTDDTDIQNSDVEYGYLAQASEEEGEDD